MRQQVNAVGGGPAVGVRGDQRAIRVYIAHHDLAVGAYAAGQRKRIGLESAQRLDACRLRPTERTALSRAVPCQPPDHHVAVGAHARGVRLRGAIRA
ncbi:Uncharacterised protein [Bordetella pertussis]|nr:Uncharacterised protein [Bordetella pertussis]